MKFKIWRVTFLKSFFTIKKNWDGHPVFTQEMIYHMHTEMRQSLMDKIQWSDKNIKNVYKIGFLFLNLQSMGKVIRLSVDFKSLSPRGCMPLPRGYIHV